MNPISDDAEGSEWKKAVGFKEHPVLEMHELVGHCSMRNKTGKINHCCWEPVKTKNNTIRKIGDAKQYVKITDLTLKQWTDRYARHLDDDEPLYHAVNREKVREELATAFLEESDCPFDASRRYRKTMGLLMAIADRLSITGEMAHFHTCFDYFKRNWTAEFWAEQGY